MNRVYRNAFPGKSLLLAFMSVTLIACTDESKDVTADATDMQTRTSAEDVQQKTEDLIETIQEYGSDQRDVAIREVDAALDKLDRRIDAFATRFNESQEELSEAARTQVRSNLEMLRAQRAEISESYRKLKSDSGDAWDHTKQGFSEAYEEIVAALDKAEREFDAS